MFEPTTDIPERTESMSFTALELQRTESMSFTTDIDTPERTDSMSFSDSRTLSTSPAAVQKRAYRDLQNLLAEQKDRINVLLDELALLRSKETAFLTVVAEFTKLNESLQVKLVETESTGQAVAIGQRVLSDPDLKYLVESIWFQSPSQQDKLRNHVRSYRRSLKT